MQFSWLRADCTPYVQSCDSEANFMAVSATYLTSNMNFRTLVPRRAYTSRTLHLNFSSWYDRNVVPCCSRSQSIRKVMHNYPLWSCCWENSVLCLHAASLSIGCILRSSPPTWNSSRFTFVLANVERIVKFRTKFFWIFFLLACAYKAWLVRSHVATSERCWMMRTSTMRSQKGGATWLGKQNCRGIETTDFRGESHA